MTVSSFSCYRLLRQIWKVSALLSLLVYTQLELTLSYYNLCPCYHQPFCSLSVRI